MKKNIIAILLLLIVLPLSGKALDMSGKYGLGYFNTDAPLVGRFWLSPTLGLDLGLGFEMKDIYFDGEKEKATSFWLEAGLPFVIKSTERANFFVRPGVIFASLDDRVYGTGDLDEKWSQITLTLTPGAEVFFGEHFSLTAGHGIAVDILSVPDAVGGDRGGESEMTVRTFDGGVSYLGFHFYFK